MPTCDSAVKKYETVTLHEDGDCGATTTVTSPAREPSFLKPDPFLAVPPEERYFRTLDGKDSCAVRDADETNPRYFLRVLMPFSVEGLSGRRWRKRNAR